MPKLAAFRPEPSQRPICVAVCGNSKRLGFREVVAGLRVMKDQHKFTLLEYDYPKAYFADVSYGANEVDMFLILQEYPGQFDETTFDRLRRRSPLARCVLLLDSLCRGELRTGRPASLWGRFYLDQWNCVGRKWFEAFLQGRKSCFTLPQTCSDTDLVKELISKSEDVSPFLSMLIDVEAGTRQDTSTDVFIVSEHDTDLGRFVVELCSKHSLVALRGTFKQLFELTNEPKEIVVDCVDLADKAFKSQVERISQRFTHASIRVLAFAPHADEIVSYESLPHCRVLGKPF